MRIQKAFSHNEHRAATTAEEEESRKQSLQQRQPRGTTAGDCRRGGEWRRQPLAGFAG